MNELNIKPRFNKRNGQINFSLPRRKLSAALLKDLSDNHKIKIKILKVLKEKNGTRTN